MSCKDLGDFQTSPELVSKIIKLLGPIGKSWSRVLEPTCGRGSFIKGLIESKSPPLEIRGFDVQNSNVKVCRKIANQAISTRTIVNKANIFNINLRKLRWDVEGNLLVIGNPPWVTSSELGRLSSKNIPEKENIKNLSGMDAITGSSNFDVSEYIWLKLMRELKVEKPSIALLCKTSVARNVLKFAHDTKLPVSNVSIHRIDARRWFGTNAEGCLFRIDMKRGKQYNASIYSDLTTDSREFTIGIKDDQLVNLERYQRFSFAKKPLDMTWRQGVKHDAVEVFELTYDSGVLRNKLGEIVDVESSYVYPLLKSSDLANKRERNPPHAIIITQRKIGEDTSSLKYEAPRLWNYLVKHSEILDRRKSSVYDDQHRFSIYGIGAYSFAPWKVGISGFYKNPQFRLIGPIENKPVMLDDTCYFLPCDSPQEASIISSTLNCPLCQDFINSISFQDSKRPITKRLLQSIPVKDFLMKIDQKEILTSAIDELKLWKVESSNKKLIELLKFIMKS